MSFSFSVGNNSGQVNQGQNVNVTGPTNINSTADKKEAIEAVEQIERAFTSMPMPEPMPDIGEQASQLEADLGVMPIQPLLSEMKELAAEEKPEPEKVAGFMDRFKAAVSSTDFAMSVLKGLNAGAKAGLSKSVVGAAVVAFLDSITEEKE